MTNPVTPYNYFKADKNSVWFRQSCLNDDNDGSTVSLACSKCTSDDVSAANNLESSPKYGYSSNDYPGGCYGCTANGGVIMYQMLPTDVPFEYIWSDNTEQYRASKSFVVGTGSVYDVSLSGSLVALGLPKLYPKLHQTGPNVVRVYRVATSEYRRCTAQQGTAAGGWCQEGLVCSSYGNCSEQVDSQMCAFE